MAKVLIVEDDPILVQLYNDILSFGNYQVILVENGLEVVQRAKFEQPDLIYLDIMMPKISGQDILKLLKCTTETKDIPVVMLTNLSEESMINRCIQLGALDYVIKANHSPQQILDMTEKYLQKKSNNPVAA